MGLVVDPTELDLTVFQGATYRKSMQWLHGATRATVQPVDLTTATARAQIRKRYGSSTAYCTLTTADGTIVLDDLGSVSLYIEDSDTALLPPGDAVWDLEITWPDGDVCRLLMGKVAISPEATLDE